MEGGHSLAVLVARLQERYDPHIESKILNVYVSGSQYANLSFFFALYCFSYQQSTTKILLFEKKNYLFK